MNLFNIRRTFVELRPIRKWDTIYWLIDVHGVIIPGSWKKQNDFTFIVPECKEVLQWLSNREDQRIIIWTSSQDDELVEIAQWLGSHDIIIDYWNGNPEVRDTEYASFSEKPYFNILLDDKSSFVPETDWSSVKQELIDIGEWYRIV